MRHEIEDHDRGLSHDLRVMDRRLMERRQALAWLGSIGGAALVAGCGEGGGNGTSSIASAATSSTTTTVPTTVIATTTTTATTTASSATCIADPTETNGPYPADGTNASNGSTSNVLLSSGIVRSDIRSSFLTSTTVAQGVAVTLKLTLVNSGNNCAPLAGYAIYVWHCDASGNYSLYGSAAAESYLRGVLITDADGQVTFTTIYPACYSGRWPHIHFEVYTSLATATSGRAAKLTSQLAMPVNTNATIFNGSTLYVASIRNYAQVSLSSDNVFGDNSAQQITMMTPTMTGSLTDGYVATATIGLSV